ncbi:T9SS type A sorting domain-containing protein [bacterium]|nr:T9SS type A sorting domain-containing protein [bacterium]
MLGIDQWNGSTFAVEGFGDQGGATFPLLTQGSEVGNVYQVDRQYVIIDQEGIVQLVSSRHGFNATAHRAVIDELLADTDAPEPEVSVPDAFSLVRTWPNPFNSQLRARFRLSESAPVSVSIYNVTGQQVDAFATRIYSSGEHEITWSPSGASGIYILRLDAGALGSATRRVVYVR